MTTIKPVLLALCAAAAGSAAAADAASFFSAFLDTTPAGLVRASDDRSGAWSDFWADTKAGVDAVMKDGNNTLIVPTLTIHPRFDWPDYREENAVPAGTGLGRTLIDERGNERTMFFVNFVDSNYNYEPMVGYQWLARYPIGASGLHVGAGYLLGLTFRDDYHWLPVPAPLPVAKIGTDTISFYGTYIPITNVAFFYTTITIDDAKRRDAPLPAESPWSEDRNFVYGGWGWQYMDNAEEASKHTVKNDALWHAGIRHYSGRHWATDLSYRESKHDIRTGTGEAKEHDFKTAALQIQYNMDVTRHFRLYAGGGFGWSEMKNDRDKDSCWHPVLSMGGTYAFTRHLFVNAEVFTAFTRFEGTTEGASERYKLKSSPTDLTVSVGYAF